MTNINLLPWRETLRKEKQRELASIAGGAAILMGAVIFYIHIHVGGLISAQDDRNRFLQDEIKKVETVIEEIKEIKSKKKQLLARMNIIQELQTRRPEIVHVFEELVNTVPSGVYLTKLEQKGQTLSIRGTAQSNARISSLMRNLDESDWFEKPKLDVISSKEKENIRTSEFMLLVNQTQKAAIN